MTQEQTIIVADDDRSVRTVIRHALMRQGYQVLAAQTAGAMFDYVAAGKGALLITDVGFPDGDALTMLPRLIEKRPDLPMIVMSARTNLLTAIQAQQNQVFEYLPKPFELSQLLDVSERALKFGAEQASYGAVAFSAGSANQRQLAGPDVQKSNEERQHASRALRKTPLPDEIAPALVGQSVVMQSAFKLLARYASQNVPVLIIGEAGTGKEEVAHTLYQMHNPAAERDGWPARDGFLALDFSRLPEQTHLEKLDTALGAPAISLFLNNIEGLSADAQMRLVRWLENPIAAQHQHKKRLILGTRKEVRQSVEQGHFREDLYFAISTASVNLPPLRDRLSDILLLSQRLLADLSAADMPAGDVTQPILTPEAVTALQSYSWPGNMRELKFLLHRLYLQASDNIISEGDVRTAIEALPVRDEGRAEHSLSALTKAHIDRYFAALGNSTPAPGLYDRVLAEIERPLIIATLEQTAGNQIKAAQILGVNRNTLRKKIVSLKIDTDRKLYRPKGQHDVENG